MLGNSSNDLASPLLVQDPDNIDISNVVFAIASMAAGIIAFKCTTSPHPKPIHAENTDILFNRGLLSNSMNIGAYISKWLYILAGTIAAILSLDPKIQSPITKTMCPNYNNLSDIHIKPNIFSIGCLATFSSSETIRFDNFGLIQPNATSIIYRDNFLRDSSLCTLVATARYSGMFSSDIFGGYAVVLVVL